MSCVIASELDEVTFTTLIKSFVEQWEKKEPKFVIYFQNYYCNRTAMYIPVCDINMTHIQYSIELFMHRDYYVGYI